MMRDFPTFALPFFSQPSKITIGRLDGLTNALDNFLSFNMLL